MLIQRYYYDADLVPVLAAEEKKYLLSKDSEIQLPLGKEVYCTGFTRDGRHLSCPKNSVDKKQCLSCANQDDWLTCLRCNGSTCLQFNSDLKDDCFGREYVVYLASFGSRVKAGISKKERVRKRWIEQGADYATVVFQGVNGQEARLIESELFRSGLESRLTVGQKLEKPAPDPQAIPLVLERIAFAQVAATYQEKVVPPQIEDFSSLYSRLDNAKPTAHLVGRVLGYKGPLLLLENNGPKVFPLPTAVGRKVLENTLANYF